MSFPIVKSDRHGRKVPDRLVYNAESRAKYQGVVTYLQGIIPEWLKLLDMGFWDIEIRYEFQGSCETKDGSTPLAQCWTEWEYRKAIITFYIQLLGDHTEEELEGILVHELMHIYVRPMRMWWPEEMDSKLQAHCISMEEMACNNLHLSILHMKQKLSQAKRSRA